MLFLLLSISLLVFLPSIAPAAFASYPDSFDSYSGTGSTYCPGDFLISSSTSYPYTSNCSSPSSCIPSSVLQLPSTPITVSAQTAPNAYVWQAKSSCSTTVTSNAVLYLLVNASSSTINATWYQASLCPSPACTAPSTGYATEQFVSNGTSVGSAVDISTLSASWTSEAETSNAVPGKLYELAWVVTENKESSSYSFDYGIDTLSITGANVVSTPYNFVMYDSVSGEFFDIAAYANSYVKVQYPGLAVGPRNPTTLTSTTLTDTTQSWSSNQWSTDLVYISAGTGAGQFRTITASTADSLTINPAWSTTPSPTSSYEILVPGNNPGATAYHTVCTGYANPLFYNNTVIPDLEIPCLNQATLVTVWVGTSYYRNLIPSTTSGNILKMYLDSPSVVTNYDAQVQDIKNSLLGTNTNCQPTETRIVLTQGSRNVSSGFEGPGGDYPAWLNPGTYGAYFFNPCSQASYSTSVALGQTTSTPPIPILNVQLPTYTFQNGQFSYSSGWLTDDSLAVNYTDSSKSTSTNTVTIGYATPTFQTTPFVCTSDTGRLNCIKYPVRLNSTTTTGTSTSSTGTTFTDSSASWSTNQWKGFSLQIDSGQGQGQTRYIVSNTATVLTLNASFSFNPPSGSSYYIVPLSAQATSATSSSLTDTHQTWSSNQWTGYSVQITSGTGRGESAVVVSNTATTLTISGTWTTTPDSTSRFAILNNSASTFSVTLSCTASTANCAFNRSFNCFDTACNVTMAAGMTVAFAVVSTVYGNIPYGPVQIGTANILVGRPVPVLQAPGGLSAIVGGDFIYLGSMVILGAIAFAFSKETGFLAAPVTSLAAFFFAVFGFLPGGVVVDGVFMTIFFISIIGYLAQRERRAQFP